MNNQVKRTVIRTIARMGDGPAHQDTVVASCRIVLRPQPTVSDVLAALDTLEQDGFIVGKTEELVGRWWSLTPKGMTKAASLS